MVLIGTDCTGPYLLQDSLHLVLRVEVCFGEKRTALSREILLLQQKFSVPACSMLYHGGPAPPGEEGVWDMAARAQQIVPDKDWEAYCREPYTCHQDYINDLMDTALRFPDEMRRREPKGKKKKSVLQIIEAGASYKHFAYLRNGSHVRSTLSPKDLQLLSNGTCANEALHAQWNAEQKAIVQQHAELVATKVAAFGLGRLLAHNAAAYSPTIAQRSQREILCILQGHLMTSFVDAFGAAIEEPVANVASLQGPVHALDKEKSAQRQARALRQHERWEKHETKQQLQRPFKRLKALGKRLCKKRTVFTQKKQQKVRKTILRSRK